MKSALPKHFLSILIIKGFFFLQNLAFVSEEPPDSRFNSDGRIKESEWMCNEAYEGKWGQPELYVIIMTNSGVLELQAERNKLKVCEEFNCMMLLISLGCWILFGCKKKKTLQYDIEMADYSSNV